MDIMQLGHTEWAPAAAVLSPTRPTAYHVCPGETEARRVIEEWQSSRTGGVVHAPDSIPAPVAKSSSLLWLAAVARGTMSQYVSQIVMVSRWNRGWRL